MSEGNTNYLKLEQKQAELTHLSNILMLAHWDTAVMISPGSVESRLKEVATVSALHHKLLTSNEFSDLIKAAEQEVHSLDEWQKANLKLISKNYQQATCLTEEVLTKHSLICGQTEFAWRKARQEQDFKSVEQNFDDVFDSVRTIAKMKSDKFALSEYDALLDGYDADRKTTEIKSVYEHLRAELPLLIQQIRQKQEKQKVLPLKDKIDKETQKQIGLKVMKAMGFNFDRGRVDVSTHPFCIGSNDDVRITTRYDESNFLSGLYGIIHETGHALYQQNLPAKYRGQPVGSHMGMSFHESQSLIMELQACNSLHFTSFISKLLQDEFGIKGPEYDSENLYKLITEVKPSFIRVEADEVTYPLHVIIRFEIEQEIINNKLKAKDLPQLWNNKIQEYLGIKPSNDAEGCLQDIHWPSGTVGYFPSYTNGAIIASMLMKKAKEKNADIDSAIEVGNFEPLNSYLNDNFRSHGGRYKSSELLNKATGHDNINSQIFLDYISQKYLK